MQRYRKFKRMAHDGSANCSVCNTARMLKGSPDELKGSLRLGIPKIRDPHDVVTQFYHTLARGVGLFQYLVHVVR